jgi:hypothetical protein
MLLASNLAYFDKAAEETFLVFKLLFLLLFILYFSLMKITTYRQNCVGNIFWFG